MASPPKSGGALAALAPHWYAISFLVAVAVAAGGTNVHVAVVKDAVAAEAKRNDDHDRALGQDAVHIAQIEAERDHLRSTLEEIRADVKDLKATTAETKADVALVRCRFTNGRDCKQ